MATNQRTNHADADPWYEGRAREERFANPRSPRAKNRSESWVSRRRRLHPRRWWRWALLMVLVLLVATCGTYLGLSWTATPKAVHLAAESVPSTPTLHPDRPGYLATGSDFVDFMWWNDRAGDLSGSAVQVVTQGVAPGLSTTSYAFEVSGTLRGSAISLSYDHGPNVLGSVSDGTVSLEFPKPDSTLVPVQFESASAQAYAGALENLGERIDQANQTAESGLVLQQEEQAIKHDEEIVADDIALLTQDEAATSSYIAEIPATLQEEASSLAGTLQIEQQVTGQTGGNDQSQSCGDATRVASGAQQVAADDSAVEGDAGGVEASLSTVNGLRGDIAELQKDFSQLREDEVVLPGYVPPSTPGQTEVTSALAVADSTVQWALSTTNGYIDQANGDMATAFLYETQTYRAGNCGTGEPAPPPAQHIS